MLKRHVPKIYMVGSEKSGDHDCPVYTITDGWLFRTVNHPMGWSEFPDYEFGNDGKIYRTKNHPRGESESPDYEFRGNRRLYRTANHEDGSSEIPEFEIRD